MPAWLVIADDLTGACDTGAVFARRGLQTVVRLRVDADSPIPACDVLVVSTGSRSLPESQAAEAVRRAARSLPFEDGVQIYHKIDSTLRGHPGAELRALMAETGLRLAVLTPAFPAQGRVVRSGRLWVHGQPVEETPFAREVPTGSLADRLGPLPGSRSLALERVRLGGAPLESDLSAAEGVILADAETDEDLLALARAGQRAGARLWCGSAGLARALAAGLGAAAPVSRSWARPGLSLVVAGSRSTVTGEQVSALEEAGAAVYAIPGEKGDQPPPGLDAREAAVRLHSGRPVVICARGLAYQEGGEARVAESLAAEACRVLEYALPATIRLILTGGDTAAALCRHLGCTTLRMLDELQPGLALAEMIDGRFAGLQVVTKAGGFGRRDSLVEIVFPAEG